MAVRDDEVRSWWQHPLALVAAFALGACLAALVLTALPKATAEHVAGGQGSDATQEQPTETDAPLDRAAAFPSWNADSAVLDELVSFVEAACDEDSSTYVEPQDRIATFDMDGTIISEKAPFYLDYMLLLHRVLDDPTYQADAETVALCEEIRSYAERGEKNSDLSPERHRASASEFAGMTPEEFRAYVRTFLDTVEVQGFAGMTYGESLYQPMREVIAYLQAHDFDVWMVSASQREIVRAVVEPLGIEPDHVIANDLAYVTTDQGDELPEDHAMAQDEEVVLAEPLYDGCEKAGKALAIAREIGKRPTLAFGNSSGDYGMLNYTKAAGGFALLVVADDTEREYGDAEKAAEAYEEAAAQSWVACSMKDDWATIYGEGVVKTELAAEDEEELAEAA